MAAGIETPDAAQERVAARCIHFGACGGCQYQDVSYPAQIALKKEMLHDTLLAAGVAEVPKIAVYSAEPWGYRNRIRLRVGEVDGAIRVGYNRREGNGGEPMLPVTMCPIATPVLWRMAETIAVLAGSDAAVRLWMKAAVEMELFTAGDEAKVQLTLFVRKVPGGSFGAFCARVKAEVPELAGAGVAILPAQASQRGRRSERPKAGEQWGAAGMMYPVGEAAYWVSRGSFFQVNRFLVGRLAALATEGRRGALAWDLYAGVGLFTRALTKGFEQVVAVEAAPSAAADLAGALKGTASRAVASTTVEFLEAAVVQRERPELIVMDPPRAGIGPEACALLARVRAPEMVYVSCDPVTLARDLNQLMSAGYRLAEMSMVDMFPQTVHVETVAVLRR
jgi:23S rRNA (uracil1939-C5)-methyltransferase